MIESPGFVGSLSGRDNLRSLAALRRLPDKPVDEVLEIVGLIEREGDITIVAPDAGPYLPAPETSSPSRTPPGAPPSQVELRARVQHDRGNRLVDGRDSDANDCHGRPLTTTALAKLVFGVRGAHPRFAAQPGDGHAVVTRFA